MLCFIIVLLSKKAHVIGRIIKLLSKVHWSKQHQLIVGHLWNALPHALNTLHECLKPRVEWELRVAWELPNIFSMIWINIAAVSSESCMTSVLWKFEVQIWCKMNAYRKITNNQIFKGPRACKIIILYNSAYMYNDSANNHALDSKCRC